MAASLRTLKRTKTISYYTSSTLNRWYHSKNRNKHPPFAIAERRFASADEPPIGNDANDPEVSKKNERPHPETVTLHHMDMLEKVPVKGKIFEKLPFRIFLEAGKKYSYCTCGYSKNQPFCDGSHKAPNHVSTRPHHVRYRPISFKVEESKEYWLCNCKQSNNRPFCDGSHKGPEVQKAVK